MIIGVSGKARSGKDLLYSFASKENFQKISFASLLKKKVRDDFGLTFEHTDGALKDLPCEQLQDKTPRQLMIEFGNLYRSYDSEYWIKALFAYVTDHPEINFMITDCRYKNEAGAIKAYGGFLVRLERHESRDGLVSEETKQSSSETALDDFSLWDAKLEAENNETPEQLASFWNVLSAVVKIVV